VTTNKIELAKSVAFKPYVAAKEIIAEMTPRALILGALFGILFGASSVYLALKVGLTVSASVPIAVLSITLLRYIGRSTILENNIVQTTGSAGESIAAGVVFTLPALLILGLDLDISRTTMIALAGGWLGVLLMVPLRRSLIVKEHGNLPYPEGTACAEVLMVGEKGGTDARTVFVGFGTAFVYKILMVGARLWKEYPEKVFASYQNSRIAAEVSPELLGVGYIIGPRVAAFMVGGGILAALVMIPTIKFFGMGWSKPLFPEAVKLIADMSAGEIQDRYVRYIAAGAVATGGIISLIRALPTIVTALSAGLKDFKGGATSEAGQERTSRDLPLGVVVAGVGILAVILVLLPQLDVDIFSSLLIVVFGFLFVTVSSRITGQIGASSNPISGMTIATLLFTSLIFLVLGRDGAGQRIVALTVGAIVCVAAANAGATSQDLKTGFLVGATPRSQQIGLLVGATASAIAIGFTLTFFNDSALNLLPVNYPTFKAPAEFIAEPWKSQPLPEDGKSYKTMRLPVEVDDGQGGKIQAGKYLVDDQGALHYFVNPGVGGITEQVVKPSNDFAQQTFAAGDKVKKIGPMRGLDDKIYTQISVAGLNASKPDEVHRFLVDDAGKPQYEINDKITKYPAPKAALMGILVDGVLTRRLPWSLILIGVFISITLEIIGLPALPIAVGMYLPISTSMAIFAGGGVRALVDRQRGVTSSMAEEETGRGVLFSSGLIAGGAIAGLAYAMLSVMKVQDSFAFGPRILGDLAENDFIGLLFFAALAGLLFYVGRQEDSKPAAPPHQK
jgi:putative OPT family oligopeptide transporter